MKTFWLWLPSIVSCRKPALSLLTLWGISYSITKKGLKDKNKAASAWTSKGPSRQLSMPAPSVLLSLPHVAEDKQTSPFDPSACDPLQKWVHYLLEFLCSFWTHPQPSMRHSHLSFCSPAWKGRSRGVLGGIEITNVEVTGPNRVHAATARPKSTQ